MLTYLIAIDYGGVLAAVDPDRDPTTGSTSNHE